VIFIINLLGKIDTFLIYLGIDKKTNKTMDNEINPKARELAGQITDYVNRGGRSCGQELAAALNCEHRTLQQSTMKVFLEFVEFASGDDFRTDGRNEATKQVAKRLMKGYIKVLAEEQNIPQEDIIKNWDVYKPSKWLPLI